MSQNHQTRSRALPVLLVMSCDSGEIAPQAMHTQSTSSTPANAATQHSLTCGSFRGRVFGCVPAPNTAAPTSLRPRPELDEAITLNANTLERLAYHTWYQHRTTGLSIPQAWSSVVSEYRDNLPFGVLPRVVSSVELASIASKTTQRGYWAVDISARQSDAQCLDALLSFGQEKEYLPPNRGLPGEMDTS